MNDTQPRNTRARERFLDAILQSAIEYLDGLVTSWNEGAMQVLGWAPEEVIGRPGAIIFTEQDKQDGIPQREMTAALDQGGGTDERWHLKKDGSLFWASGQMMALRSEDGAVEGYLKILRDRTDQHEAQERQRMLMHELSHRMKNTLTVVQAITSQTFRNSATLEDAAASISARLTAYSKAHDILLQRDWLATTLAAIVEATAESVGIKESGRFRMHGPSVEVGPQAALAFSLVLHELATNASKYGALSTEPGAVEMRWAVVLHDGLERLAFTWTESGGPEVKPPERTGFGSRLITSTLQSFGDVVVDYWREGLLASFEGDLRKLQYKTYADAAQAD
ncbi:PAS domain S-box-containing protein [Neorhizobium sp. 2083]|uniref:sensor histidine kinase n=1 Tax=Neorhizobium sp. 2083 TaxID=2817762 RepID=UPI00285B9D55|nr:HWE histidine kinase domain-containing protein [Neorhizobium sp. 2083]MDR6820863.1 PAS domain S-box-containing protein [Neorhizobium sp. 2083]